MDAVKSLLNGDNVVVVQPTGEGKSACMFLPSLVTQKTTIVIVPTVSLIFSHLQYLQKLNIAAVGFGGIQGFAENQESEYKLLLSGEVLFALMTPEYLMGNAGRIPLLQNLAQNGKLQMVAFDEIHCAINWKQFREAYLRIESLKNELDLPIMLLTATARPATIELLATRYLSPNRQLSQFIGTADRPNISLAVEHVKMDFRLPSDETKVDAVEKIEHEWQELAITPIVDKIGSEKAIIYVDNTALVDYIANLLLKRCVATAAVKGGEKQTRVDRLASIQTWLDGDVQVVVATCAFGLGVSRPDIRPTYIAWNIQHRWKNFFRKLEEVVEMDRFVMGHCCFQSHPMLSNSTWVVILGKCRKTFQIVFVTSGHLPTPSYAAGSLFSICFKLIRSI